MSTKIMLVCFAFALSLFLVYRALSAKSSGKRSSEEMARLCSQCLMSRAENEGVIAKEYLNTPLRFSTHFHDGLKADWRATIENFGPFRSASTLSVFPYQNSITASCLARHEEATVVYAVVLDQRRKVSGIWNLGPQPSLREYGEHVEETTTTIGKQPWLLGASLTRPESPPEESMPAVVLVHGSGPLDRDETVGVQKPFRDIAMALSANGIVVLRYDKRTYLYAKEISGLPPDEISPQLETIDDALSAVEYLLNLDYVDKDNIFIVGHSFGGYLVPEIMRQTEKVYGSILLSANAFPLLQLILEQQQNLMEQAGDLSASDEKKLQSMEKQIDQIMSGEAGDSEMFMGAPVSYWRRLEKVGGPEAALEGEWPMLVVQGGEDRQVSTANFDEWAERLKGHPNCTFKFYPDLNHLLQDGGGTIPLKEVALPMQVNESVLQDMSEWIKQMSETHRQTISR